MRKRMSFIVIRTIKYKSGAIQEIQRKVLVVFDNKWVSESSSNQKPIEPLNYFYSFLTLVYHLLMKIKKNK